MRRNHGRLTPDFALELRGFGWLFTLAFAGDFFCLAKESTARLTERYCAKI
jgi:hypothetical protein